MTHALPPPETRVRHQRWLLPGNVVRVTWRPSDPKGYSRFTGTVRHVTPDFSCVRFRGHQGGLDRLVATDRIIAVEVITEGPAARDLRRQACENLAKAAGFIAIGRMADAHALLRAAEELLPGTLPRETP